MLEKKLRATLKKNSKGDKVARRKFTEEELEALRSNQYTKYATPGQITFTDEFKEHFWKQRCEGKTCKAIMAECGYDIEVLGEHRINSIGTHIREAKKQGENVTAPGSPGDIQTLEKRIAYLESQMEFVKKTMSLINGRRQVGS